MKTIVSILVCTFLILSCSCSNPNSNIPTPNHQSEISLDDDYNVTDLGRAGESTQDGNYYYDGSVTLYSKDGYSKTFDCYTGKVGMEKGCRGVIYGGKFYNLDRNKYVTIGGIEYKAYGITD